jgi:hypothetical protein
MSDVEQRSSYALGLLEQARKSTEIDPNWTGTSNIEAQYMATALRMTIDYSQTLRSVQMQLAAEIARKELWLHHPPTPDYPDGYANLNDMLADVGFAGRLRSVLVSIGDKLVPYCDQRKIDLDGYLVNSYRSKLEDALPALKAGIKLGDDKAVENIFDDIETFDGRDSIRLKYTKTRRGRLGKGTTVNLEDNRVAVVMMIDNDDYVEEVVRRIAGMVEWGMPAVGEQNGKTTEITIIDTS